MHQPFSVGYPPPAGPPLADFGTRLLAYLIDTAILAVATIGVGLPVALVVLLQALPGPDQPITEAQAIESVLIPLVLLVNVGLVVFSLLCSYVYAVELMHRTGQTVGKRLTGIRVVPVDPARRLTRGMATRRYLVEYGLGILVPFFHYLDGLWQLWDKPYLQTLHDKVAQTVVGKVSP